MKIFPLLESNPIFRLAEICMLTRWAEKLACNIKSSSNWESFIKSVVAQRPEWIWVFYDQPLETLHRTNQVDR